MMLLYLQLTPLRFAVPAVLVLTAATMRPSVSIAVSSTRPR
jgi:hypothetical protein